MLKLWKSTLRHLESLRFAGCQKCQHLSTLLCWGDSIGPIGSIGNQGIRQPEVRHTRDCPTVLFRTPPMRSQHWPSLLVHHSFRVWPLENPSSFLVYLKLHRQGDTIVSRSAACLEIASWLKVLVQLDWRLWWFNGKDHGLKMKNMLLNSLKIF